MCPPPTIIDDHAASGPCQALERRLVTTSVEDQVAVLRICRKKARQTLNPATTFQLRQAIEEAESHPEIKGIVLTGSGSSFASGADTGYFLAAIKQGEIPRLREFTKVSNECFDAIERCSKPVVAALNGSALERRLWLRPDTTSRPSALTRPTRSL